MDGRRRTGHGTLELWFFESDSEDGRKEFLQ